MSVDTVGRQAVSTSLQVVAPSGYMSMRKGQPYVLLRNCRIAQMAVLVGFHDAQATQTTPTRWAELIKVPRDRYEAGLVPQRHGLNATIVPVTTKATLPPWLNNLEGVVFDADERWIEREIDGRHRRLSPQEEAEARLIAITPALLRIDEILLAEKPDYILNCIARSTTPRINELRFRTWFYCYVAFGYRVWALMPPRTQWGAWNRLDAKYSNSTVGRPPVQLEEMFTGRTSKEMIERMVNGFRKYVKRCDTLTQVWAMTIRKEFGAQIIRKPGEKPRIYHPDGAPIPSFDKFYYYVRKAIGIADYRRILSGDRAIAYKETPIKGSYSDDLESIGERAHYDSTHVKEYPKSYIGDYPLPALQTVYLTDGLGRQILGFGASLGAEDASSYKMALFCAAIDKSRFGEIIGYPIDVADWPGKGLPICIFSDRGAGAADEIRRALAKWHISIEMSPSYDPRSNSASEAKNPRRKNKGGAPQHKASAHTVIELVRREVQRVITKNRSDDVSGVASDRAIVEGGVKSPNDLYHFLTSRHRTSVIDITFDEAVRAFLEPVLFKVIKNRLYFKGREYSSPSLFTSGMALNMQQTKRLQPKGYVLALFPRVAWLEFNGQLVEVSSKEHGVDALPSLQELEFIEAERSRSFGEHQVERRLEIAAGQEEFKRETGKEWNSNVTRSGRPNVRSKEAKDEVRRLKALN